MPIPSLCIYHGDCTDGFSAAWAVWHLYGDQVTYVPGLYGKAPPDVKDHHVLMVDFSYQKSILEAMARDALSITILDHHKTAQQDLADFITTTPFCHQTIDRIPAPTPTGSCPIKALFDMSKSGAVMAWEYCHPERSVPDLLLHVEDRDLWTFNLSHTREIVSCLISYEYDFNTWNHLCLQCSSTHGRAQMVAEGIGIERKHQKDVKTLLALSKRTMVIGGVRVPVANMPYTMVSDAAHILAQDAPFAACYYDRSDDRVISLRSIKPHGMDVSEIAVKYHNGGGHRHAAGFQVPIGWNGDEENL